MNQPGAGSGHSGVGLVTDFLAQVGVQCGGDVSAESLLVQDLGLDSLHLIELAFFCAEALDVDPVAEEPPIFDSVADVDRYVTSLSARPR